MEDGELCLTGSLNEEYDDWYNSMIENSGSDVTMEQVMQSGEELPQTEEFLQLWMAYLGSIPSGPAPSTTLRK